MVCPGARRELLKRDCSTWAAKTWEYLSYWFFLPTELWLGRAIGNWTGTPFTTYCTCITIHSHCFCSFSIYFLHVAFMFLLVVFMSFHFNCMSFHVDDPRSGMYNPMSIKRILNAKGTAFTWLLFTREHLYFIPPVPSSTSACRDAKQPTWIDLSEFQAEIPEICGRLCVCVSLFSLSFSLSLSLSLSVPLYLSLSLSLCIYIYIYIYIYIHIYIYIYIYISVSLSLSLKSSQLQTLRMLLVSLPTPKHVC